MVPLHQIVWPLFDLGLHHWCWLYVVCIVCSKERIKIITCVNVQTTMYRVAPPDLATANLQDDTKIKTVPGEFRVGLFSCGDGDLRVCICTLCCQCYVAGKIAEKVQASTMKIIINMILLLHHHTSRHKVNNKAWVVHAKNAVSSHALRKEQWRHWITVLNNLGELSGRLHSYRPTDDISYILGLVRIVTRVSRTKDAKRWAQCLTSNRMPQWVRNIWQLSGGRKVRSDLIHGDYKNPGHYANNLWRIDINQ